MTSPPCPVRNELQEQMEFWVLSTLLPCWRHPILLVLGVLASFCLGHLYLKTQHPTYQSMAQILVLHKQPDTPLNAGLDRGSQSGSEDYLSTHQGLIRSALIIDLALRKLKVNNLPSLQGDNPSGTILAGLRVTRDNKDQSGSSSNILTLTYRGSHPEENAVVLGAILQGYQDFLADTYHNVSDETLKLIRTARTLLEQDLAQKEKAYRTFRANAPVGLSRDGQGRSPHLERLTDLEARRADLLLQRAECQEKLASLEKALREGRDQAELVHSIPPVSFSSKTAPGSSGDLANFPGGQALGQANTLLALTLQEKALLQEHGPDHPQVKAIRARIALTQSYLTGGTRISGPAQVPQVEVQLLKQKLAEIEVALSTCTGLLAREEEKARSLMVCEWENEDRLGELQRTRDLFDATIKRLQEINIVRDFGGYEAKVILPPEPGVQVAPNVFLIRFSSAILSLLSGLGLCYLAEILDRRVRPVDVARLGLPVIGSLPRVPRGHHLKARIAGKKREYALPLFVLHSPECAAAESLRSLRTTLLFNPERPCRQILQIASPSRGEGKSLVAANLALSLAQAGKRCLLIDANLREPTQHQWFAVDCEPGLAAVLAGVMLLEEAIRPGPIPGLTLLPSGQPTSNPAELLTSPRLADLLQSLRPLYDFVVVDTPAVMGLTDATAVAPRVDGILLVLRMGRSIWTQAAQARQTLDGVGASILGFIVNGVGR